MRKAPVGACEDVSSTRVDFQGKGEFPGERQTVFFSREEEFRKSIEVMPRRDAVFFLIKRLYSGS
jgi:hypothetical protein